jgi:hypothetical protein
MKKIAPILTLLLAASLWAADFWQSKPFTEWSPKEVNRMLADSPWGHRVLISSGSAPPSLEPPGERRGLGGSGIPGDPAQPGPGLGAPGGPAPGDATAGGLGGNRRDDPLNGAAGESVTLIVRWHTALPVKQAITRSKYGSEVGTSPEAKKFLEQPEPNYIISVSGLPASFGRGDMERAKKDARAQTSLNVKGRAPVGPVDVEFLPSGQNIDAFFAFPRGVAFTLADKEVEFVTRIGNLNVRYKFRLKDMVYNGKLEL